MSSSDFTTTEITRSVQFKIHGTPATSNQLLGSSKWKVMKNRQFWKYAVRSALMSIPDSDKPFEPLTKATLSMSRHSYRALDYDGLVASFKPIIDGLCTERVRVGPMRGEILFNGLLSHDGWSVTGVWNVTQFPSEKGKTWVEVKVEWKETVIVKSEPQRTL